MNLCGIDNGITYNKHQTTTKASAEKQLANMEERKRAIEA